MFTVVKLSRTGRRWLEPKVTRNRLGNEKIAKLNFIRTNQALFDEYSEKDMVEINDLTDTDDSSHSDDDVIILDD